MMKPDAAPPATQSSEDGLALFTFQPINWVEIGGVLLMIGALYLTSLYNFLLFHSLAELFSVLVATTIFVLVWNAWPIMDNGYLKFLGVAMLFIGALDLVHTLAYAGMNIFTGYDANLPTQLWIATRYMQAISLLIAPYFLSRAVRQNRTFAIYLIISTVLLVLIFAGIFPDCFIVGSGLTPFKIVSEYIIGLILVGTIVLLARNRAAFSHDVFRWLVIALLLTIGSELAFTFYISVYGFSNLVGHVFKIVAFYYIYKAIIQTGLTKPYNLLFRELKQQEQQLKTARDAAETANQAKSIFLANMSHELRSPLNVILGFAHLTLQSPHLLQEDKDNVTAIYRSGEHLLGLINNVLDMSKIEAGRSTLNENNFSLVTLLEDLEMMFYLKAEQQRIRLHFIRAEAIPEFIRADENKLRQVLINLLGNALKFTEQGSVTLRVDSRPAGGNGTAPQQHTPRPHQPDDMLYFEVTDTGPGIALAEIDAIFEPFVQSQTGRNSRQGTGLGLPISRQFVQLMGGELTISSSTLDHGTTFAFNIKYQAASQQSVEVAKTKKIIGVAPGQPVCRILVADDQPYNRRLMIKLLTPLGFELREAENGREALDIWENWQPHLIWMDMRMPVLDGYQATQQIKATVQGQATAVIALTASVFEEEKGLVMLSGCDDFVRKPFRDADIFEALHKHLGVEFLYQSDDTPAPVATPTPSNISLTAQQLMALPESCFTNLQQAIRRNDPDMVEAEISNISQEHPATASALTQLINEFRFDKLQQLFKEAE